MERKKLKFMDVNEENVLDREQMRNIMAGSGCGSGGGENSCYVKCDNCHNSTCRGYVPDCTPSSVYPICGPGGAGCGGPDATCTCVQ